MSMNERDGVEEDSSWADASLLVGLPAAVRAALVLNVPKIIDSVFPILALSAEEICKHVTETQGRPASPQNLEKIMDYLCCNGIFSLTIEQEEKDGGFFRVKKYSHSPKSRCLSRDQIVDSLLMFTAPEFVTLWSKAHEPVFNPQVSAFELNTGKFFYKYLAEEAPELQQIYVRQLKGSSTQALKLLIEQYDDEFNTLKGRVVDVGGQEGAICTGLAAKYPHLNFINFDLPEVIRAAPRISRVEHVGGSFFEVVPSGNLLIIKFCLLNWDDESCLQILKNCRKALAHERSGKLLIIDRMDRSADTVTRDEDVKARTASAFSNFFGTLVLSGARTRTLEEFRGLALAAGFSALEFVHNYPGFDLMEARADQAQEPFCRLAAYWGTMDARDEVFFWSNSKGSDHIAFRDRLDEQRIRL
ncbi:hypothetical protein R1sor_006430 [Riccia sorocarpa]|uniref:O-methyltransferase C-terminal domain-containing protein n=1 Tax=Riccia sorocarpa TaxID=122646 RepID=A0ABD3HTU6_9MARC